MEEADERLFERRMSEMDERSECAKSERGGRRPHRAAPSRCARPHSIVPLVPVRYRMSAWANERGRMILQGRKRTLVSGAYLGIESLHRRQQISSGERAKTCSPIDIRSHVDGVAVEDKVENLNSSSDRERWIRRSHHI